MVARAKIASEFYIDDHAVLYALLFKAAEEICTAKGHDAAIKGTIIYGRERGLRMAMRCKADGKPLTPNNYLNYGEWVDDRGWSDFRIKSLNPDYAIDSRLCGWNESWKKYGLEKYGKHYCTWIDKELVRGFNPENALEIDSILSHGDSNCILRFMGASYKDEEELKESAKLRATMKDKNIKDFLYHTGHILSAMRRTCLLELGLDKTTKILETALSEYSKIFGPEKTAALQEEAKQDYTVV